MDFTTKQCLIDMKANIANPNITCCPATPEDKAFLFELYVSSREREMALVNWDDAQKEAFLKMQFIAQLTHYLDYYPEAEHDIILLNEQPIGRIYVERRPKEIQLMDIILVPEHRNAGIGSRLVKELLEESTQSNKPVHLYVWEFNDGAYRFYKRFGFSDIQKQGVHIYMEWLPPQMVG